MKWALCDPDAPPGVTYREGEGLDSLVEALRDLMAREHEHTPVGYFPSGNVALYWSSDEPSEPLPALVDPPAVEESGA